MADYLDTMSQFPAGQHDDDVDSSSQALNYLRTSNLCYGLLEVFKQATASQECMAILMNAPKAANNPASVEEICEVCSSDFIQTLRGGIKRCGQCGRQWDPNPKPVVPNPAVTRQPLWRM